MDRAQGGGITNLAEVERREGRTLGLILMLGVPLALAMWCVMPIIGPVFQIFIITGASMSPTVNIGDTIIVSQLSYGYSRYSFDRFDLPIEGRVPKVMPARGDVVAFRLPEDHARIEVKRAVGFPGDMVQMRNGRLLINGKEVERTGAEPMREPLHEYNMAPTYFERLPEGVSYRIIEGSGDGGHFDNTEEFQVPQGHLFVMGDNRDNSIDSRMVWGVGYLPLELVLGRVVASF